MKQWPEIAKIENEVLSASEGQIGLLPRYSVHPANQRILLNAHNLAVRRDRDTTFDSTRKAGPRPVGPPPKNFPLNAIFIILLHVPVSACLAQSPIGRSDFHPAAPGGRSKVPA